jgi:hypothetical protein
MLIDEPLVRFCRRGLDEDFIDAVGFHFNIPCFNVQTNITRFSLQIKFSLKTKKGPKGPIFN